VCCCSCQLVCLFIVHMGGGSSPLSCRVFHPLPLSQAFPLLVAGRMPPAPPRASPAQPGLFIYCSGKDSPPPLWSSGCPTLFATCFIVLIAYYSVSLFSLSGVGLSRGLC
jgi:hypothetical protein